MNKYLNFAVEEMDIVEEKADSQFATAKIGAFNSGVSLNHTNCTEDVLKSTAHTIYLKPILYNLSNMTGDFGTHVSADKTLIGGFIEPNSESFVRVSDGRLRLEVSAKLWKKYSPKAMEIFKQDGGKKKISVEIELIDSEERPDGLLEMKDFAYTGVCILGDLIQEASEGSSIEIMSFSKENEEYMRAVQIEFGSYEDIDFTIPEKVKHNIEKGLALYKEHNRGATSVSLALARFIAKNGKATPEKIRHIAKTFKSNKFKNLTKSPPSDDYIGYMLHGGSEAMEWSELIGSQLDERDSEQLSYFSNDLTFPYKSLKDINPALAGIDPPITLGQANAIARQADAIGSDDEKNGWAIAISKFKRSHKVVDGRWVKKNKMSYDFSLNSAQILEVLNAYLSGYTYGENKYCKYWVQAYDSDEGYVFFRDSEEGKGYRAKYNLTGAECTIDLASKEEVISAGFMPVKEKINMEDVEKKKEEMAEEVKEEEKKEEMATEPEKKEEEKPAEDKKEEMSAEDEKKEEEKEKEDKPEEEKKEEMSLDQNMDVAATLAMLANETDAFSGLVRSEFAREIGERDYAKMFEAMCGKMSQMAEENKNLKSFKASMEQKQFDFEVNSTMKYIEEKTTMPKDQRDALVEESKKFSLETIDGWKNLAKAKGLDFAIKDEKEDGILRFANPWGTKDIKKSLWD